MWKCGWKYGSDKDMRVRNYYIVSCVCVACVCAMCACKKQLGNGDNVEDVSVHNEKVVYVGLLPVEGKYLDEITGGELDTQNEVDYKHGTLYLSDWVVEKVLVSDAAVAADYSPWRLPTRLEAGVLKTITVDGTGDSRYICIDSETGGYYTFKFGSGSVTKAGAKTKYNIRPIRVVYDNDSLIIRL